MAVGAWTFYNHFKKNLGLGKIVLSGGVFHMTLHTSASNATTATLSTYGSVTGQVAAGNGYLTSGQAFTHTWTSGASAAQWRFNFSPALVWTGTGGTISNIKFAVIWTSGVSALAKKLICYSQLSTAQFNLTINNTLTITAAATGVFNLA
jgi:hypothetical protein